LIASLASPALSPVAAQSSRWSEPVLLSTNTRFSWFPDLAVDSIGRVHVVWDSSPSLDQASTNPLLRDAVLAMHTVGDNGVWTAPNDIWFHPVRTEIYRLSIAADAWGQLYLTSHIFGLSTARADEASSAQAWSRAQPFLAGGNNYGSEVTIDAQGAVHVVWDQLVQVVVPDPAIPGQTIQKWKADIFYRRSADGGRQWTSRIDVSDTVVGENRAQIKVDQRGMIYASWDNGWDRLTEESAPIRAVVFRSSSDDGKTWSDPTVFEYPDGANAQMAIAPDNKGGVLAVWRSIKQNGIFYAWSTDDGRTWSSPQPIPSLLARDWNESRFDGYHMAADSAGVIHLAAVGRLGIPSRAGLYHLTWNGSAWSVAEPIYTGEGYPEWPRIDIGQGNHMHVVWFVRDQLATEGGNYTIWYSAGLADAPEEPLPPTPTPTPSPVPAPATPTPRQTATPLPTLPSAGLRVDTGRIRSEMDDLAQLALAIVPLALLLGMFVIIVRNTRMR
jgi:hypothetical protein